jgi:dsRNA-specific ribonuclease
LNKTGRTEMSQTFRSAGSEAGARFERPVGGGAAATSQKVPTIAVRPGKRVVAEPASPEAWQAKVRTKVRGIYQRYAPKEMAERYPVAEQAALVEKTVLELIFEPARFARMYKAFVHASADAEENYELLEAQGDKWWTAAMTDHFSRRFQDAGLTEAKLSNFISTFGAGANQTLISRNRLGFDEPGLIRVGTMINYRNVEVMAPIYEDVMEAWIGATYWIGEGIEVGLGHRIVLEIANSILGSFKVSITDDYRPYKNRLSDRFAQVKWNFIKPTFEVSLEAGYTRLYLPQEARDFLRREGLWNDLAARFPKLGSNLLVSVAGHVVGRHELEERIYREALAELDKMGLTEEWFERMNMRYFGFKKHAWFNPISIDYERALRTGGSYEGDWLFTFFRKAEVVPPPGRVVLEHVARSRSQGDVVIRTFEVTPKELEDASFQEGAIMAFLGHRSAAPAPPAQRPASPARAAPAQAPGAAGGARGIRVVRSYRGPGQP